MTLLEKIKATTWYNSILKHREILLEFFNWNIVLESRVEELESSVVGGASTPTLQEVTDVGYETTNPIKSSDTIISQIDLADETAGFASITPFGELVLKQAFIGGGQGRIRAIDVALGNEPILSIPNKVSGEYTIATTADIPTTATDIDALKRDGSNANSDIDIGGYGFKVAGGVVKKDFLGDGSVGLYEINTNSLIADYNEGSETYKYANGILVIDKFTTSVKANASEVVTQATNPLKEVGSFSQTATAMTSITVTLATAQPDNNYKINIKNVSV